MDHSIPRITNHSFFIGFGGTLLLLLLVSISLPMKYGGSDDIVIIGIVSGKDGLHPDNYVIHTSQILNNSLYFLYKEFPSVSWYGLFLYAVTYVGASLFVAVLIRNVYRIGFILLISAPVIFIYIIYCFLNATYTTASLLISFGVLLSFIEWQVNGRCVTNRPALYALFLVVSFLLAMLFRWKLSLYFIALGFPLILFFDTSHIKVLLFALMSVFMFLLVDMMLLSAYDNKDYVDQYVQFNHLREEFFDTNRGDYHGDTTYDALRAANWTVEDYQFFQFWNIYDERLFNARSIEIFLKRNNPLLAPSFYNWDRLKYEFVGTWIFALTFLLALLSSVVYKWYDHLFLNKMFAVKYFVSICSVVGIAVVLSIIRYRLHVFVPVFIYILALSIILPVQNNLKKVMIGRKVFIHNACRFALFILFVSSIIGCYSLVQQEYLRMKALNDEKTYIRNCLNVVKENQVRKIILFFLSPAAPFSIGFENIHPLKEYRDYPEFTYFPAAWQIHSPRYISILRQYQIGNGKELLRWAIDEKDVLFVLFSRDKEDSKFIKFLWESYIHRRVSTNDNRYLEPVYDFTTNENHGLTFYKWK